MCMRTSLLWKYKCMCLVTPCQYVCWCGVVWCGGSVLLVSVFTDIALIWYTGHGQRGTGNWCFKDGFVTFEQILQLYKQHFFGKMLTLVCDCCYAGQWTVHRFAETLDSLKIGACGHKAMEAGYYIKVFTACHANQTAFDTYFAQHAVRVDPNNSLMTFYMSKVQVGSRSQAPNGIDSTATGCFGEPDDPCKFDQIPPKAQWKWIDLPIILVKRETSISAYFAYGTPRKGDLTGDSV